MSFLCFLDGVLSFSVSVLWSVFVVVTGGHCWTMLTGNVNHLGSFTVLTVNSVSAHGALHADTLICSLLGSFSFFSLCTVLEQRTVKPVERQSFSSLLGSNLLGNLFRDC